jgi:hypothetical protein
VLFRSAIVGNEGILGISLFMGGDTTPSRAVVRSAGYGYRLRGPLLKQEFKRLGALLHLLLRYTQALITQMTQTAACNRHHSIEQQLCRWLLLSLDRVALPELTITQEMIANMLGVRREGVTEAAGKLQRSGLIRYARGHIEVIDRPGIEAIACECYAVVRTEFDRLLPAYSAADALGSGAVQPAAQVPVFRRIAGGHSTATFDCLALRQSGRRSHSRFPGLSSMRFRPGLAAWLGHIAIIQRYVR